MQKESFEVAEASGFPTVRQISVFLDNRVGQLMRLTKLFDRTEVRILALSVVNSVDCAITRLLVDDPDEALRILDDAGFPCSETEVLVVTLPFGKRGLLSVCHALLSGEININYAYPLLVHHHGHPALAVCPDNIEAATATLRQHNFEVMSEYDLRKDR